MQTGINHYVKNDRINNASFRQKLDPMSKNILRTQNPLELVFEDISTFDAKNPIVRSLLNELDAGKKDIASELIKKSPKATRSGFCHQKKIRNRPEPKDDDDSFNLSPPPSPPRPP